MSDLVGNPEDRFSPDKSHFVVSTFQHEPNVALITRTPVVG